MRHYLGLQESSLRASKSAVPIYYEPSRLINSHLLLCGNSGTGKSHQSKRLLDSASRAGVEIDIFDVHEELENVEGGVAVKYSQATNYGYNPLILETDAHAGGVQRQVDFLVEILNEISALGIKQETALRHLLTDCYAAKGIFVGNQSTWIKKKITEKERIQLLQNNNYSKLLEYYPTLEDVRSYAMRKIKALTLGGNDRSIQAFDDMTKAAKSLTSSQSKYNKVITAEDKTKALEKLTIAKQKANEAYYNFTDSIETGREFEDILKYDSVDVIKSVLNRIDILNSTGTFRANEPPFQGANVRVHQIKSLTTEQQVLFVKLRMREIFDKWKNKGPTKKGTELRHIIFLDEAHKFFTRNSSLENSDIIAVVAKEARKFGIGLWCASQQPTEFPESFLSNCGAKILLGIDEFYWTKTRNMLKISEEQLRSIQPKRVLSIKISDDQTNTGFNNIVVPNPASNFGLLATKMEPIKKIMESA